MKKFLLSVLLILSPLSSFSQNYYIIFASNLNGSGGVHREDASGADLYCVKYNSSTKTISDLTQLTTDTTSIEWFPSLSPDAKWIAYNNTKNNTHEIRIIDRFTKATTTIYSNARYPEWIDNNKLLVSSVKPGKKGIYQLDLDLSGTIPLLLAEKMLTDTIRCHGTSEQSDAYPFPDYKKIVFHSIKTGQYVSAVSTINTDGTGFENLTNYEGVGHAIVNSCGDEIVYASANNGVPVVLKVATKAKFLLTLPKTGNDMTAYGNPFPGYPGVHWTYPAWGTSNHSLILSAQAVNGAGDYEKSRIYLIDLDTAWKNANITDLSTLIESAAGKTGKEFCTASLREAPNNENTSSVIYVNLVSHNVNYEDNSAYPNYIADTASFWKQRSDIIEMAKMLKEEGVKYNFETDWTFLMALDLYDKPMINSNNKKLLKYLVEDLGFEVDGCLHGSKYNYADLAYLFNKQGITQNTTIGGFLASPPDSFQFDIYKNGITSKLDPTFKWYPKILHAPATYKHINEAAIALSGLWKPKSKYEFTTHDNNGPLICVGIYNGETDGLRDLLVKQENGELLPGKIYSQTIFLSQNLLNLDTHRKMINSFKKYATSGRLKWVGIRELVDIWETQYNSEPNQLLYPANSPTIITDSATDISGSGAVLKGSCMPNNNNLTISFEYGKTSSLGSSITANPSTVSGLTLISLTASVTGLSPDTKYYYRIKAFGGSKSFYGLLAEFTTANTQLTAPSLITPSDNQINIELRPTFSWSAVSGASKYTLQISDNLASWTNPIINLTDIVQTGIKLSNSLLVNKIYFWKVQALSNTQSGPWSSIRRFTTTSVNSIDKLNKRIPTNYEVWQNYPNPFNPQTRITFGIPKESNVKIIIYNSLGQIVSILMDENLEPGEYSISWNGKNNPSGIYYLKMEANQYHSIQKMLLIK